MSRDLSTLQPETEAKVSHFLMIAAARNLRILVYCTRRSLEDQARLYRQGRPLYKIQAKADELAHDYGRSDLRTILLGVGPQRGRKVTNAGPGQSMHNYGYAADAVPMINGKPLWRNETHEEKEVFDVFGRSAEEAGLEWAGRWHGSLMEVFHVQEPGKKWQELILEAGI